MTDHTHGGEPLLCGYTARRLLDLELAASEAKATLSEVIELTKGATHGSRFAAFGEIERQSRIALTALEKALYVG